MNNNIESAGSMTSASIERTIVATGLVYEALVDAFERELARWDPEVEDLLPARKAPWSEVEHEVARLAGSRGLIIFQKIDQGIFTSLSGKTKRCALYLVGNPVIASQILDIDSRGALYVPFRVCLYDDGDSGGASIMYDRPSSSLAALGHPELAKIGVDLDAKIDGLATALRKA